MKYCSKCGKELPDEAVVCIGCGCSVAAASAQKTQQETSGLATGAIVFAFLMPLVGLILGIIGCCKYTDPQLKKKSTSAIILSVVMWIVYAILFTSL